MLPISIKSVRRKAGYDPKFTESVIQLGVGDGSKTSFFVPNRYMVDGNGDDVVDDNDVTVYVDGSSVSIKAIYPDKREIVLSSAPALGKKVTATYYHSDMSDTEIQSEIQEIQEQLERDTNRKFSKDHYVVEYFDGDNENKLFVLGNLPAYQVVTVVVDGDTLTEDEDYWLKPDSDRVFYIEFDFPPSLDHKNIVISYYYGEYDALVYQYIKLVAASTILLNELAQKGHIGFFNPPNSEQTYASDSKPFTLYKLLEKKAESIKSKIYGQIGVDWL